MPLTCAVYCRISLDKTGEGLGVERQETECRALATQIGLTVQAVYVDNDISAYSGKRRPAFEAMLASGPEAIVVWHVDRLLRRVRDLGPILELGINVHAVSSGYVDLSTPAGRLSATVVVAAAEYESAQKGERQKAMHRQRRARGGVWWKLRPFGFNSDGTLLAPEADALAEVYHRFADGEHNLTHLARDLAMPGTRGSAWSAGSLRSVLVAERNRGSIVEDETWDQVNEVLAVRARGGRGGTGILTRLLRCGVCQGRCEVTTNDAGGPRFYRCKRGHVSWPRGPVDAHVAALVAEEWDGRQEQMSSAADPSAELTALAMEYGAGGLSDEEFKSSAARIRRQAERSVSEWVSWSEMSDAGKQTVLEALVSEIQLPPRVRGSRAPADVSLVKPRWQELF